MRRFRISWVSCTLATLVTTACSDTTQPPTIVGADSLKFALGFATYLGGTDGDMIRDAAVDGQGNILVAGGTRSPGFPTTAGTLQPSFNSSSSNSSDAFITKFDANGHLLWSTFLGGPGYDRVYAMEVDELGFIYVAGRAGPGFPVTAGAFQTTFGGDNNQQAGYGPTDGFVCKIRPDGSQIVFCSYFGNEDFEVTRDIAVDANHNIYVGSATSFIGNFPSAWFTNAYQKTVRGGQDALVARIKGDGSRVEWATLLGGTGEESVGISVRVDGSGVYVETTTSSTDIPTPGGFDHALAGALDVYLAKLSPDGSQLLYGTYVGGSGSEGTETHQLAVDQQGNAFVATASPVTDFPVPGPSLQPQGKGRSDILIVKVGPVGQLLAATYLGGSEADWAEGIATDTGGNLYLSGSTGSPDFPVTGGQGPGGGDDLIAVVLSSDLSRILFSRRLGGGGSDNGRAVAVGASAFVSAGMSDGSGWPVSAAAQASLRGSTDGIVSSFTRTP